MNKPAYVLEATGISKTYQEGRLHVPVLAPLDIAIAANETVAIMGSSGSGKSTLLHVLGGLDSPTTGGVHLMGEAFSSLSANARAKQRNQSLGFVYQFHHLLPEFSAIENVAMPLWIRGDQRRQAKAEAADMLARVGLSQRLKHKPAELSGGEKQRVAIARALVTQPHCVLADEPTGNLDNRTAAEIQALIQQMNDEMQTSFVMVTHDRKLAQSMQRCLHLQGGQLRSSHDSDD